MLASTAQRELTLQGVVENRTQSVSTGYVLVCVLSLRYDYVFDGIVVQIEGVTEIS